MRENSGPVQPREGSLRAAHSGQLAAAVHATEVSRVIRYWSLYRCANRWDFLAIFLGTIGSIINGAVMPAFSIILGTMLNDLGDFTSAVTLRRNVNKAALKLVCLGLAGWVGGFCQGYFLPAVAVRQVNRMRAQYLSHVLQQEIGYFDTSGTSGYLLQGLNEDCISIQAAVGEKTAQIIYFLSTANCAFIAALVIGWDVALVCLSLLPLLGGAGFALMFLTERAASKSNNAYAGANSLAQQALSNVRTVYSFNAEEKTVAAYKEQLDAPMQVGIKQGGFSGGALGLINCIMICSFALGMWYGSDKVIAGQYNGGQLLTIVYMAINGGVALGQGMPIFAFFEQGKESARRLFSVLDRRSQINADTPGKRLSQINGQIEVRNVTFSYPSRPEKPVFCGLSFTVPAGSTAALVGGSGSGKSTVVQLIERFYDPQGGAVLLDGADIKTLNLRWLRAQMGLVSQEPTLFATTIWENILLGKPGASDAEVEAAARAANAHTFVEALPHGYNTFVGEKGVQMSGGQKQRIAIARAMLKKPKILLLDEATSALDAESERVVQEALDKLMVGRTTVMVAHRLSTVRNADTILVMKQGRVIEQGKHTDLMAADGAYAALVRMQQQSNDSLPTSAGVKAISFSRSLSTLAAIPEARSDEEELQAKTERRGSRASFALIAVEAVLTGLEATRDAIVAVSTGPAPAVASKNVLCTSDSHTKEPAVKVPFSRLAALSKPEMPAAFCGMLGSVIMGLMFPFMSLAIGSLMGIFYNPLADIDAGIQKWCLVFVGLGVAALFASWMQSACFNFMGHLMGQRIRVLLMQALLRQDVGWFDDQRNASGVLTSKLSTDALAVKGQFGDTMGLLTQNIVTILGALVIALFKSWRVALVAISTLPIMAVCMAVQYLYMFMAGNEDELYASANSHASEAFLGVRAVAAFGMEEQVSRIYARSLEAPTRETRKRAKFVGIGLGISSFCMYGTIGLWFWYMGQEISSGRSSFSDAYIAFLSIWMAANGIAQAQGSFPDVAKGKAAVQRVFSVIDRKPKIDASNHGGIRPVACAGELVLRDVSFAYPMRPEARIFSMFNLAVPAGATVALVGESGSGKSTVVGLIERFYDPVEGSVLLDGVDIKTLNLRWLRSQIGLVGQEPALFNMSVAENIRYGRPEASLESVIAAAKAANAHAFIEALPESYSTLLGEGAIQLSGGQKQRIAIARAVVKDPKILLLDEATSALDAESERVVQEALDKLMVGRSTVMVAHRLSTVRNADRIAVVSKGRIIEQGRHDELLALDGAYASLVARQMEDGV